MHINQSSIMIVTARSNEEIIDFKKLIKPKY